MIGGTNGASTISAIAAAENEDVLSPKRRGLTGSEGPSSIVDSRGLLILGLVRGKATA